MAARAIWKGKLKLGRTIVPVALYSAVVDRTVRFHVLDQRSETRVKQHMVSPESKKEVTNDEIQKGYQIEPGVFVILSKEELEKVQPKQSRDIELSRFVPPQNISSLWYDRPYYLGPDGDQSAYFALAEALVNEEIEGIAHWVMRGKEYVGALRAQGDYLMLVTLRHAEEVVPAEALPSPEGRAIDKKEINMARQLIEALAGEFNPEEFRDEYRERVMEFIEQKAKGKKPRLHAVKSKEATPSLASALSKSIAALKKQKEKKQKEKIAA
ncbi:MAG TPA: Ku protein [Blastocatellia bacterium]|nr:Ku protein [Blastocatellia bacterium]